MSADPQQGWRDLFRLLRETGRRFVFRYAIAMFMLFVVSATTAASAYLIKNVINDVFIAKSTDALFFVSAAIFMVFLARGVASYIQGVMLTRISNAIVADAQLRLAKKILQNDVSYTLSRTSSDIIMQQNMAAGSASAVLNTIINGIGRDALSLVGLVGVMIVQDPFVSLFVLISFPIATLAIAGLSHKVRRTMQHGLLVGVALNDQLRQVIQGFKIVKAYQMEAHLETVFSQITDTLRKNADRIVTISARSQPIVETLAGIAIAFVILYGGWRVIYHDAPPGEFFSFITALLMAYDPARRLANARVGLEQSLFGLRILYTILDEKPAIVDKPNAVVLENPQGTIRFQNVNFAYNPQQPTLQSLDISFELGQTTALVGASGSGKSTILSLILRFWHPQSGQIFIGEQNIEEVTEISLRHAIAYVGQDAFLFDGSIRDNIAVGRQDADFSEIEAAARAAEAHEFILAQPQGYDTPVGELASRLSGGQKQRIAIARAFLCNAPILLLDEPTAALDALAEEALRQTLNSLAQNRTTILVAHRLTSVMRADKIVVLSAGEKIEEGNHETLIAKRGAYAELFEKQVTLH